MRDFKKFNVWHKAMALTKAVYHYTASLPAEEKYGLQSQIRRSAVSIPSNIAEGCGRASDKEFKRFLDIALGSAFELETQLILVDELDLVNTKQNTEMIGKLNEVQRMINGLIQTIKARS